MHKDLGLALSAATRAGVSLPVAEAEASVNAAETARDAAEDFSVVVRRMEGQVSAESSVPPAASGQINVVESIFERSGLDAHGHPRHSGAVFVVPVPLAFLAVTAEFLGGRGSYRWLIEP